MIWRVFWKYLTINNLYCIEIPDVQVESDEDIFAIKALNLYLHLKNVKSLKLCREVPVFGWIGNLFLLGKIDELRHVDKDNSIELSEFKTRTKSFLPSAAQQKTHNLQVMIYKVRNFNDLINYICTNLYTTYQMIEDLNKQNDQSKRSFNLWLLWFWKKIFTSLMRMW